MEVPNLQETLGAGLGASSGHNIAFVLKYRETDTCCLFLKHENADLLQLHNLSSFVCVYSSAESLCIHFFTFTALINTPLMQKLFSVSGLSNMEILQMLRSVAIPMEF